MSNFYNQASWVLVPSGIEEDIVFAQKPISGLGDLTYTRASDATYTDSTGVVRRSPYNLLQQSEMFSNAIWTKTNSTIGIDATVAPNGTLTADLFTPANATTGRIDQVTGLIVQNNNNYTGSFYFKNPTLAISNITFYASDGSSALGANRIGVTIDLATFAATAYNFGNGVTTTVNVTAFGNNWYRASFTGSVSSGATGNWAFVARVLTVDGTINGTNGLFLWGAQLVEGTEALDYFPTTNRQDVPRIDFRNADGTLSSCGRLLLEPQRTNSIRNSSMVGAVAGTPGTLPTNWAVNLAGLTQTIVGIGVESGLPYIDLRFNGTASGSQLDYRYDGTTQIAATSGQVWTHSFYYKIIAQPQPPLTYAHQILERSAAGGILADTSTIFTSSTSLSQFQVTRTLNNASTAFVQPQIRHGLTIGQTYDFTIRIAAPQMELGAYATTWVPTTTAAVTRIADTASKTGVSSLIGQTEGTLFAEVNFDTRQLFSYFLIRNNPTTSNFIGIGILQNDIRFEVVNGSNQALIVFSNNSTGRFKIAAAYKQNDFVLYVNGVQRGSDNSGTVPSCSEINAFVNGLAVQPMQYTQAALFTTRLTNAQLAELTTL